MKPRHLAWGLWVMFLIVISVATYFGFNPPDGEDPIRLIDALWAWSFIGFPTTGALIAMRFPRRPLGWVFCVGPLLLILAVFLSDVSLHVRLSTEGAAWFAWVSHILFSFGLGSLLYVPFLLPDGRLTRGRLRTAFHVVLACQAVWLVTSTFAPGPLEEFPEHVNPAAIEAVRPLSEFLGDTLGLVMLVALGLGVLSIVLRFRRSEGQERLQAKWMALGASFVPLAFLAIFLIELMVDLSDFQVTFFMMFAILSVPGSIAIAMLKHRLFEIDQIINRALVYALVTALLVVAYVGLVFALQLALEPVTADSDLAVAASTLAVAALFRPMRNAIQAFIDRRFYRKKYDATRALGEFGTRLRDEVDLDVVRTDIVGVLRETVQPAHMSVWLKDGAR